MSWIHRVVAPNPTPHTLIAGSAPEHFTYGVRNNPISEVNIDDFCSRPRRARPDTVLKPHPKRRQLPRSTSRTGTASRRSPARTSTASGRCVDHSCPPGNVILLSESRTYTNALISLVRPIAVVSFVANCEDGDRREPQPPLDGAWTTLVLRET